MLSCTKTINSTNCSKRTAIIVVGVYSDIFFRNNFLDNTDIYMISFSKLYNISKESFSNPSIKITLKKEIAQNIVNCCPEFNNFHISHRAIGTIEYLFNEGFNDVKKYEKMNNIKYDIIIYTTFRHIILKFPQESGTYYTWVLYSLLSSPYINAVEVLSSNIIRLNGGSNNTTSFYELPPDTLQEFLNIYFNNKVYTNMCSISGEKKQNGEIYNTTGDDIVIGIPSAINVSNNTLSYVNYRSIFTASDRLDQTITQLESIDKYIPQCKNIFLLEGSRLDLKDLDKLCKANENVNIILCCLDETANYYANEHTEKAIYEMYVMKRLAENIQWKYLFKFGGRYSITPNFNLNSFLSNNIIATKIDGSLTFTRLPIICTVLYSINYIYKNEYIQICDNLINLFNSDKYHHGIEGELYLELINLHDRIFKEENKSVIKWLECLNVEGMDGIESKLYYL
jgi:hypothetical protein